MTIMIILVKKGMINYNNNKQTCFNKFLKVNQPKYVQIIDVKIYVGNSYLLQFI